MNFVKICENTIHAILFDEIVKWLGVLHMKLEYNRILNDVLDFDRK